MTLQMLCERTARERIVSHFGEALEVGAERLGVPSDDLREVRKGFEELLASARETGLLADGWDAPGSTVSVPLDVVRSVWVRHGEDRLGLLLDVALVFDGATWTLEG